MSLSDFDIKVILALNNEFGSVSSFSVFLKCLRNTGSNSFTSLWNSPVKPFGPGLFFYGRFSITASVFLVVIDLFTFSVSS